MPRPDPRPEQVTLLSVGLPSETGASTRAPDAFAPVQPPRPSRPNRTRAAHQGELLPVLRDWNCLGIILPNIPSQQDALTGDLFVSTEVHACLSAFHLAIASLQRDLSRQATELRHLRANPPAITPAGTGLD